LENADLQERIAAVLAGDIQKFEGIMQVYQRPIFFYCYHMLGQYNEAEDCGQEVFLKAYRSLGLTVQATFGGFSGIPVT
jgi:DNA-directed RNA polymerase specialized sigma24 family protein